MPMLRPSFMAQVTWNAMVLERKRENKEERRQKKKKERKLTDQLLTLH